MSPEWYYYYGKTLNMGFPEVSHMPVGRMMDLIACHQIKHEGAKLDYAKVEALNDEAVIPHWR